MSIEQEIKVWVIFWSSVALFFCVLWVLNNFKNK
jgi:hypothetical protein